MTKPFGNSTFKNGIRPIPIRGEAKLGRIEEAVPCECHAYGFEACTVSFVEDSHACVDSLRERARMSTMHNRENPPTVQRSQ